MLNKEYYKKALTTSAQLFRLARNLESKYAPNADLSSVLNKYAREITQNPEAYPLLFWAEGTIKEGETNGNFDRIFKSGVTERRYVVWSLEQIALELSDEV